MKNPVSNFFRLISLLISTSRYIWSMAFLSYQKAEEFLCMFCFFMIHSNYSYSIHRTFLPVVQIVRLYFFTVLVGGGHLQTDDGRNPNNLFYDMGTNYFFILHIWISFSLWFGVMYHCHIIRYTSVFHLHCLGSVTTNDTEMPTSFFLPFHRTYLQFYFTQTQ